MDKLSDKQVDRELTRGLKNLHCDIPEDFTPRVLNRLPQPENQSLLQLILKKLCPRKTP